MPRGHGENVLRPSGAQSGAVIIGIRMGSMRKIRCCRGERGAGGMLVDDRAAAGNAGGCDRDR
jgi:hypothetical protein